MNKVLVTGGCGFIGFHMIKRLITNNYKVLNLDFLGYASSKKDLNFKKNYQFKKVDIKNFVKLKEVILDFSPDYILNFAAESHVDNSIKDSSPFIYSNIVGTFNLLEISRGLKNNFKKFIHISTDEVFGSLKLNTKKKFTEQSVYDPSSPYSASKASSDHLVKAWGRTYKTPFIITNCSNNFGPRQFHEKLIPVVINSCINNCEIPIYGNGKNIRDWIYVEDHCEAIELIIKKGKLFTQYLIGSRNNLSNIKLVKKICKILDRIVPNKFGLKSYSELITFVKDRLGHDKRYSIEPGRIEKELKWKPKHNFDSALLTTIKWYLKNKNYWK